jgi:ABC-2 type transport system permease protein
VTSFRNTLAYKADFIIYIIANMVFFFIYFALWKNIYTVSGLTQISNYSLSQTITYYFITSIIFRFDPTDAMYLNYVAWSGNFTNDLIKPWNAIFVDIIYTLNELLLRVLLYIPFCIFIFIVVNQYISLSSVPNLIYFLVTVILGVFLSISFYYIIHALCFHFGDQDANIGLVSYIVSFLAGGFFPLAFLPQNLKTIFGFMPFRFLFDVPANIYLGKLTGSEILLSWGQMILWTILFFGIFYIIYRTGLKKYTGTGR